MPHNDTIYSFNYLVLHIEKSIRENKKNNINNEDLMTSFIASMEKLLNEILIGNIIEDKYTYINWLLKKPFLMDMTKIKLSYNYDCSNILIKLDNHYDFIAYTITYLKIKITQKHTKLFPIDYIIIKYEQYVQLYNPTYKFN